MEINDSDSAAGTYMKPCEALPMRAKMTADKKKKELWCDLKDGDNRESVTIPFAMERALTKCLSGRNLKNFVEWAVSSRLCM